MMGQRNFTSEDIAKAREVMVRIHNDRDAEIRILQLKPWLIDSVDFYLCKKSNFAHKIQELRAK